MQLSHCHSLDSADLVPETSHGVPSHPLQQFLDRTKLMTAWWNPTEAVDPRRLMRDTQGTVAELTSAIAVGRSILAVPDLLNGSIGVLGAA